MNDIKNKNQDLPDQNDIVEANISLARNFLIQASVSDNLPSKIKNLNMANQVINKTLNFYNQIEVK